MKICFEVYLIMKKTVERVPFPRGVCDVIPLNPRDASVETLLIRIVVTRYQGEGNFNLTCIRLGTTM